MDVAVTVGLLGIVASIGMFLLGRWLGRRDREADRREQRVQAFVETYVDRARRNINTGITALVPAGVFRLKDDSEVREALDVCGLQLGKHPLGKYQEILAGADLKKFFEFVATTADNFATTSVEDSLAAMQNRKQG